MDYYCYHFYYHLDIVKKMLLAFRMNIYAKELITDVVTTFKTIVLCNWTTESIRAIATFLASTAPKGNLIL